MSYRHHHSRHPSTAAEWNGLAVAGPTHVEALGALPDWVTGLRAHALTSRLHLFEPQLGEVVRGPWKLSIATSPLVLVARSASLGGAAHRLWAVLTDEPNPAVLVICLDGVGRSELLEVVRGPAPGVAPAFLLDPVALVEWHRRHLVQAFEALHPVIRWVASPEALADLAQGEADATRRRIGELDATPDLATVRGLEAVGAHVSGDGMRAAIEHAREVRMEVAPVCPPDSAPACIK